MENTVDKKVELVSTFAPLHNRRVLVIPCYYLVYPYKVPMEKKRYTDSWLFFIVEFQTDVTNNDRKRKGCG